MVDRVKYSFKEELFNAISHWLGFVAGIVGLVVLIIFGVKNHSPLQIVGFSIYGACIILLYLFSALYHSIPFEKAKTVLRIFDHLSIYLLIAGTYTPIILNSFSGSRRIVLISLIWGLSVIGVLFKVFINGRFTKFKKLSTVIYLALGWLSILFIKQILLTTSFKFIVFLLIGGVLYSLGTIFYMDRKIPYNHAIWHIFVLAASVAHFIGIFDAYAI